MLQTMEQEIAWLLNDKYSGNKTDAFYTDVKQLKNGAPLAYLIGWVPFLNTKIYLDSRPLIPRSETEFWVARAIEDMQKLEKETIKVLDLCAGSGCIGVAVMKAFPNTTVHFAEIDERHHATIQKNITENNLENQSYAIFGGSFFENITDTYDVILTNPPYIDPQLSERIESSVLVHEPHQALFGGSAGMELITEIIQSAPHYLNPNGVLYIEHEPEQKTAIESLSSDIKICEDQYGVIRYSIFRK